MYLSCVSKKKIGQVHTDTNDKKKVVRKETGHDSALSYYDALTWYEWV